MHPVVTQLAHARVIPVIRTSTAAHAATAVEWLREVGLTTVEITLTTPGAVELIRELAADPALLVGAGTVPDAAMAQACLDAGARFLVTPWVDPEVCAVARAAGAAMLPGAFTPTEVRAALAAGADAVKVFPASSGGTSHLRALRSVFPGIAFCPTGGVDPRNTAEWFAAGAAFVGMGGKLADEALISAGDKAALQDAARAALA
ncbi:MAG: bifunctional 4-hydroxy-2-oxoglutarate aldolase/2-dehydro-3-deoxy-phosphogluconate aldolase [Roseococcus sp.]|nr:bifunctional 4-hydroxy-2-oxoglutarate aldolase/2-dehydro-3-deoxy-phosphogluconate aldolase [Roseococcus sp.]